MSLLLTDSVYTMEATTAKRGVYPMHGYMLGIYRLPVRVEEPAEFDVIINRLKGTFNMDMYADRIYATYEWKETNGMEIDDDNYEEANLSIKVEIVTGEVIDLIYQVNTIEKFGNFYWIQDYRKKADHFAKMIIDTMIRNTIISDKLVAHYAKTEKISEIMALKKIEEMTPLAKIIPAGVGMKAPVKEDDGEEIVEDTGVTLSVDDVKIEPIDPEFKSKLKPSKPYVTEEGYEIKTWGYKNETDMGVYGSKVGVSMSACIADGACADACPVSVFDWLSTPNHPTSTKKIIPRFEDQCITCLACEIVCPTDAIKIF